MFRIKICGITNLQDAQAAIDAGASALGLNFYRASKRFVDLDTARQIAKIVPTGIATVGVFVNHTAQEIQEITRALDLPYIQLHGDEPPEFLVDLPATAKIIRAYRCGPTGLAPLARYLEACIELQRTPAAVLIDSDAGGAFGGTGQTTDWSLIARERALLHGIPIILAGGLTPANVAAAIAAVSPNAVDVASGVESQPGKKDHDLITQFITTARTTFAKT